MKKINIFYWICTGMLVPGLGIGSVLGILSHPGSTDVFVALGYPAYLAPFLGVARILGLIALFTPGYARVKEWAYAGLAFDIIGAIYSQLAMGFGVSHVVIPLISLMVVGGSYILHHKRLAWQKEVPNNLPGVDR